MRVESIIAVGCFLYSKLIDMMLKVLKERLKRNKLNEQTKRVDNCRLLILDISCEENKLKEAIGVDVRKTKNVDVIADARYSPLTFKIKHFSHHEVKEVI